MVKLQLHLIRPARSGIDLDNNTIGIAFTRVMCDSLMAVGVTQDGGRAVSSVSSTAAHELGHIFNMEHDDSPSECGNNIDYLSSRTQFIVYEQ